MNGHVVAILQLQPIGFTRTGRPADMVVLNEQTIDIMDFQRSSAGAVDQVAADQQVGDRFVSMWLPTPASYRQSS